MATATVRFYQQTISDGNMRTMSGAKDIILAAQTQSGNVGDTLTFAAAPTGSVFCTIETDENIRYTTAPQAKAVDDSSSPFPAAAFVEQGPVHAEQGHIVQVRFY